MWFLYIIYSNKSDIFYVGISQDVQKRLTEHNVFSSISFTAKHRPWTLMSVFHVSDNSHASALKLEKFIKKQKSRKLILKLIDPEFVPQIELALLVRVPHVRD